MSSACTCRRQSPSDQPSDTDRPPLGLVERTAGLILSDRLCGGGPTQTLPILDEAMQAITAAVATADADLLRQATAAVRLAIGFLDEHADQQAADGADARAAD